MPLSPLLCPVQSGMSSPGQRGWGWSSPGCSKDLSPHTWWSNGPLLSILAWRSRRSGRAWGSLYPRRPWWPSLTCRTYSDKTKLKQSHKKEFPKDKEGGGSRGRVMGPLAAHAGYLAGRAAPLLHPQACLSRQGRAGSWDLGSSLVDKPSPGTEVGLQFMLGRARRKWTRLRLGCRRVRGVERKDLKGVPPPRASSCPLTSEVLQTELVKPVLQEQQGAVKGAEPPAQAGLPP